MRCGELLVEKYALVRTASPGFSACTRSQLITYCILGPAGQPA
ncbi:TA system toxin CbtA family protein [Escherichia coli]